MFFSVLCKRTERSLRSFPFFAKEGSVLFRSLEISASCCLRMVTVHVSLRVPCTVSFFAITISISCHSTVLYCTVLYKCTCTLLEGLCPFPLLQARAASPIPSTSVNFLYLKRKIENYVSRTVCDLKTFNIRFYRSINFTI